ncbi:MAG: ferritin [Candidatus Thermoplasmatota archaeon]
MIKEKIEEAINNQINAELWSAYLYLSMSTYFESKSLGGFANWMRNQAQEEVAHAMRFYNYVNDRGGRVKLQPIEKVPTDWKSPLDVFQETYKHEQKVTEMINDLVDLASKENDHATYNMLQWFVEEQVEEEDSAEEIVEKLKLIGDSGNGLLRLDKELGQRTFTPPTESEE